MRCRASGQQLSRATRLRASGFRHAVAREHFRSLRGKPAIQIASQPRIEGADLGPTNAVEHRPARPPAREASGSGTCHRAGACRRASRSYTADRDDQIRIANPFERGIPGCAVRGRAGGSCSGCARGARPAPRRAFPRPRTAAAGLEYRDGGASCAGTAESGGVSFSLTARGQSRLRGKRCARDRWKPK